MSDNKMKRILFVDHTPFAGGSQLVLSDHIRRLDKARFAPHVACTDAVPALVEQYREAGATVHLGSLPRLREWHPAVPARLLKGAASLRRVIRSESIDLVVANTTRAAYLTTLATLRTGVPLVWWVRDFGYGRAGFRALAWFPKRIICVSQAIREFYGGADDGKYSVVPVGSDLYSQLATYGPEELLQARERWGLRSEHVVIGYIGRLVAGKGPQDLIRAMGLLRNDYPMLRLLMVGTGSGQEGDVEAELHREVEERALSDVVRFTGYRSEEALLYQMIDVFVLTSRFPEAMPTSVIQAMMAGKPVVATATGGTPEVVHHGRTGLLVPAESPRMLADAIRSLLDDPRRGGTLAAAGREWAVAKHLEEVTTGLVEEIYEQVLAS